jgi:hypothetical protein
MIGLTLLFCLAFILFGVLLDVLAKKKGYRYSTDAKGKPSSESELLNQAHVNQSIAIGDSTNS